MDFNEKPEMYKYFLLYNMMTNALTTDDVVDGTNKSLYLLKSFINSGDIVLYRKDESRGYVPYISDSTINSSKDDINFILTQAFMITEQKQFYELDLNWYESLGNMLFIYIKTDDSDYILSINNYVKSNKIDDEFWFKVQEAMLIILKRAELYEKNTKAINIDLLTELDNRNSYQKRIGELNEVDNSLIYGIFDLFRLKFINDNYGHSLGDAYIKKVAKILNKYWPKTQTIVDGNVEIIIETGHCVYRIGGDEFALLTNKENVEVTRFKASMAAEEVSLIDFGVDNLPLGLNYGVTSHVSGDFIQDTYERADDLMKEDKQRMYKEYGLKRRK